MRMRIVTRSASVIAWTTSLLGFACAPQQRSDKPTRPLGEVVMRPSSTPPPPATTHDTNTQDQARLTQLEREARALARTDGCSTADACRTAPVGWRGCGGPRTYLVYCAATTDTAALFRKLQELEAAERRYNASSGMMSTCEFRTPPGVRLRGRSCREVPGRAAPGPM
jgi:hypothetical protein